MILNRLAIVEIGTATAPAVLSERSLAELADAFQTAAADSSVAEIVLTGPDGMFLAGADVRYFGRCVLSNDVDRLLRFTEQGRRLFDQIAQCPKRVVAWVRGPAIGAGLELALACHHIVASSRAKFSLPETGLGIYPGLGGTQRTPRRIGAGLAKWMIFTGAIVPPETAAQIRLVDAICPNATTAEEAIAALPTAPARPPLPERFAALEQFFRDHSVATLLDPNFPLPADANLARALVQVRSRSSLALKLAESVIDDGMQLPLSGALDLEFSKLREAFSSDEARSRLLAALATPRAELAER